MVSPDNCRFDTLTLVLFGEELPKMIPRIHSRSGRHAGRMIEFLPKDEIDGLPLTREQSLEDSLSSYLWTNSLNFAEEALSTEYIQGIKAGDLDPNHYGQYTVQDAIYCHYAMDNWKTLQARTKDETLQLFFQARYKTYQEYSKTMFDDWHITSPDGIKMGDAAKNYADFEQEIASSPDYDPVYGIVAALPCVKLWNWLANQIKDRAKSNVYEFWIEENLDTSFEIFEQMLDEMSTHVDRKKALTVFQKCMEGEINFFKSATEKQN